MQKFIQRGFTLVEVMVTVGIVAILGSIAMPSYQAYLQRSRVPAGLDALSAYFTRMEQRYQDVGNYGTTACAVAVPTVNNFTGEEMVLTGSDLSWGKWIQSPVNVPKYDNKGFSSQGRDSSPSGTEGWATWTLGGASVKVTFSSPFSGSNTQTISCSSTKYLVSAKGTDGHVNTVTFTIKPAA